MKLQAQYNRISFFTSIFVLLIAGAGYYLLLHYVLEKQLDETLVVEQVEIQDYVHTNHALPQATTYKDQRIEFSKTDKPFEQKFQTLQLFDEEEKEYELSRRLIFPININGQNYIASVTKSQETTQAIIGIILLITIGLIIILSILLYFANHFLVKRLWQPFHDILHSVRNFNLDKPMPIKVEKTTIKEFNELNENISIMTDKAIQDYISLKHFTDFASHEMQTPLAIINSKLDILIQDPSLDEKNLQNLQVIYDSVNKMSKLGQSLLLLAKIENNQFPEKQSINIRLTVSGVLEEFEEWISAKSLNIDNHSKDIWVTMNQDLADILVRNLMINAIKHTNSGEFIRISTSDGAITITNPGSEPLQENQIFNRFWKSAYSDGTGLGLAIAKQICMHYDFTLRYEFVQKVHQFSVLF